MSENCPTPPSSPYATEGTTAHWVCEDSLLTSVRGEGIAWYHYDGMVCEETGQTINTEMIAAASDYHKYVVATAGPNVHLLQVEKRFDLSWVYKGMFGTSDASVYHPERKHLDVFDFKYGAGVEVDPQDNPQGAFYAIGAAAPYWEEVETITFHIVQPRISSKPSTWVFTRAELHAWAAKLREAAIRAEVPNAPRVPDTDACRFCAGKQLNTATGKAHCPEYHTMSGAAVAQITEVRKHDVASLTPDQLAKELHDMQQAEQWVKNRLLALRQWATTQADALGVDVPGYKLVNKRAIRKWTNPDEVIAILQAFGFEEEQIFKSDLRSPAQIEDLRGNDGNKIIDSESVNAYTDKADNGVELVPLSDKRPAIASKARFNMAFELPAGARPLN